MSGQQMQQTEIEYYDDIEDIRRRITQLKKETTMLQNRLAVIDNVQWLNISREVSIKCDAKQGKIHTLNIYHQCWVVGHLDLNEYPNFRVNSNYKIVWDAGNLQIFWNGKR